MAYVLINVGCIECGVSSNVVGCFTSKTEADAIAEKLLDKAGWREGGQNDYVVFELPEPGVIKEEYLGYLADDQA